jgi:plastocyanin
MLRKPLLAVGASALLLANIACHGTTVSITDNAFTPADVSDGLSFEVTWQNDGATAHNVTSSGGGAFFGSPELAPGATFSHDFNQAGLYNYKCTIHPEMTGTVEIAVEVSSPTAARGDTIDVFWAESDEGSWLIPAGFNVDVQVNKPGPGGYVDWRMNQRENETGERFTVTKNGTYRFRARFQKGNGPATEYSHATEVVVGP